MYRKTSVLAALMLLAIVTESSAAQESQRDEKTQSEREVSALIERGLPETLTQENSALAESLLAVKFGDSVHATLDPQRLAAILMGERRFEFSGECSKGFDIGNHCYISAGDVKGAGEYYRLAVESDAREINVRFDRRDAEESALPTATLSDSDAYKQSLELLRGALAVDPAEIPQAPSDAKRPYPVRSVNIASANGLRPARVSTVEKLVKFQRGLYAGGKLGWVPGPGQFSLSVDDRGVTSLSLSDWADMSGYGRGLDPAMAKSRSELSAELSQRLRQEGISRVSSANTVIAVSLLEGAEYPVPVLRSFIAAQPADLTEDEQAAVVSSAGVVIEIPLIDMQDDDQVEDD